jgi:hypothetical protein
MLTYPAFEPHFFRDPAAACRKFWSAGQRQVRFGPARCSLAEGRALIKLVYGMNRGARLKSRRERAK